MAKTMPTLGTATHQSLSNANEPTLVAQHRINRSDLTSRRRRISELQISHSFSPLRSGRRSPDMVSVGLSGSSLARYPLVPRSKA